MRQEWYQVACCPQNTLRTLAGIREYIYYTKGDTLYVGLYVGGDAQIPVSDRNIALHVQTGYPFGNTVDIRIDSEGTFTLALRDPGWSKKTAVFLNGSRITDCVREKGMICIQRTWQKGDTVTLKLDMPPRFMVSHPRIRANSGRVCLMKGPLVYCFEEADNGSNLSSLRLSPDASVAEVYDPDLLGGTLTLSVTGLRVTEEGWDEETLYRPLHVTEQKQELKAIPYCLWNNRGQGEMAVWIHSSGSEDS